MTAIRFDADRDKVVRGTHPYDRSERGGCGVSDEETLWYLTDDMSNGRWLYVDLPDDEGNVQVGVLRVYAKHLSPKATRAFAAALLEAADAGEVLQSRIKAEREARDLRVRECEADGGHQWGPPPLTTTHATGVVHFGETVTSSSFWVCRRCERGQWLDDPVTDILGTARA